MRQNRTLFFLFLFIVVAFSPLTAQVTLPSIFTDNMVLQQQTPVAIWGWAKAGSSISVKGSWNGKKYSAKAGATGEWKLTIATPVAGGPYELTFINGKTTTLRNVMIGEVWLCSGQSNMEMPMKGYRGQPILGSNEDIIRSRNNKIRMITVPRASKTEPQKDFKGQWQEASPETVAQFSATAYHFGKLLQEVLDVPVGLITVSYGGSTAEAWMHKDWLASFEVKKIPAPGDSIHSPNKTPTVLYNGMLSPLIGFTIKGCIWYQGESNYDRPDQYENLFPAMVREWRKAWSIGDFPFYYAQIAPYYYAQLTPDEVNPKLNSAFLRDAQRKVMDKIPESGMAVLMDTGEKDCIHPANKKAAGHRLAYWALGQTYGIKGIGYASPTYDTLTISGSNAVVSFRHVQNGLTAFGKELTCFEIAGPDKRFYPAKAVLGRKSVTLSAPEVKEPVAVRYAFKDFVLGDLFGTDGLPVPSFRTDNWE